MELVRMLLGVTGSGKKSRWRPLNGNTYISASRLDSNEIPTAVPMFPGSRNSMAHIVRMLRGVSGSPNKFKMAAAKPEVLISQLRDYSKAVQTANHPFSGSRNSAALLRILPDVTGSRILKMAATKPEVLLSQLLD